MGYIHIEIESAQVSKKAASPCGDVFASERTPSSTTIVLSDGIGHGIKAHIAAQMCVSRIHELIRRGHSVRDAFARLVKTMNAARGTDMPYAVFTVMRILNDGATTILSYEMPPPMIATPKYVNVLPQRTMTMENALIGESHCHLVTGEGVLLVTDGITQAGLGTSYANGWTAEGVSSYTTDCIFDGLRLTDIPRTVLNMAREIWGKKLGDDCTALLAACRLGRVVNILTGPPAKPTNDRAAINRFMVASGSKVVCGGTTAKIVAEALGKAMTIEEKPQSMLAPPRYDIEGLDLVTEGAVTLNQVYNTMDIDSDTFDEDSAVVDLHKLLTTADRVNFFVGTAVNPATQDISFRQKGVLTRHAIISLLAGKLREAGKLVVVEYI